MKKTNEAEQGELPVAEENEVLSRLAERVERAVSMIADLRKERDQLRSRVEELTGAVKQHSEEGERLSSVEEENSRYREERNVMRTRIESMLANLETLDEPTED